MRCLPPLSSFFSLSFCKYHLSSVGTIGDSFPLSLSGCQGEEAAQEKSFSKDAREIYWDMSRQKIITAGGVRTALQPFQQTLRLKPPSAGFFKLKKNWIFFFFNIFNIFFNIPSFQPLKIVDHFCVATSPKMAAETPYDTSRVMRFVRKTSRSAW